MKKMKKIIFSVCALLVGITVAAGNLIQNGDFETAASGKNFPGRWSEIVRGGCIYSKNTENKENGKRVLLFDLNGDLTRIESRLKLNAGRKYCLTVDIKTKDYKGAGGIYITPPRWSWGEKLSISQGTNDWKKYRMEFKVPEKQEAFYRLILYGPKTCSGKIWFDNITLEEILPEAKQNTAFIPAGAITVPPVIDGVLDDECWQRTLAVSPFEKIGKYRFTNFVFEQTQVRIAYDKNNLYLGFTCLQNCLEPLRNALDDFRCDMKTHDGKMWDQDCVLLMFKTGAADEFYEVIVNGSGTVTDAVCKGPEYWTSGREINWDSKARTAVKVGNGKWTVEIAIPLKALNITPVKGKVFKACLGRMNISGNERSSYFPMQKGFHCPKYFGKIKLAGDLPEISKVVIGELGSGKNQFKFTASTKYNKQLELSVATMDAASQEKLYSKSFALTPDKDQYQLEYFCHGKDYSFMQFKFSDANGIFWQSPRYSKQNTDRMITIKVNNQNSQDITLNSFAMSKQVDSGLNKYRMSCAPGLYEAKGLSGKYRFIEGNFVTPEIEAAKNTRVMVSATKFWPEDNNHFYIAENSIQPLHVVLHNPYKKLKNNVYNFHLVIPEEFNFVGATGAMKHYRNLKIERLSVMNVGGKKFKHIKLSVPGGLPYKPFYGRPDGVTVLLELPVSGKVFEIRKRALYAWSEFDNNSTVEAPQKISVSILPPLKNKVPKHFLTQMWGGRMVNLNNRKLAREFIHKTLVGCGFNDLQSGATLIGKLKMTTFSVLNFKRAWGKEFDKLLEEHPEYILINYFGKKAQESAYNRLCPTVIVENQEVHKIIAEAVKLYKRSDYINVDYERPVATGPLSCYCERCLNNFRNYADIPKGEKLDSRIIRSKYRKAWMRFSNNRLAVITGIIRDKVHKIGRKLTFYSGYQSSKTLEQYSVDWKLIGPKIDYALCGYRTSVAIIKDTISALNGTPLITGVIAAPWHFTSREPSRQIDKAFIIKGIVLGSKGYLCYNIPQLDGRSYHAFSETAAMLREYEDIIYFGKINNAWLNTKGINKGNYALFEKAGESKRIFIVYNEDLKKSLKFEFNPKSKGKYKIYDYFAQKYIKKNQDSFIGIVKPQDFNAYCIEEK